LKHLVKAICLINLYIVANEKIIPPYGVLGYRALADWELEQLKKKCSLCRYCRKSKKHDFTDSLGCMDMSKRELIDCIREINKTARPEFLATFSIEDLSAYLEHLMDLDLEELVVCS